MLTPLHYACFLCRLLIGASGRGECFTHVFLTQRKCEHDKARYFCHECKQRMTHLKAAIPRRIGFGDVTSHPSVLSAKLIYTSCVTAIPYPASKRPTIPSSYIPRVVNCHPHPQPCFKTQTSWLIRSFILLLTSLANKTPRFI